MSGPSKGYLARYSRCDQVVLQSFSSFVSVGCWAVILFDTQCLAMLQADADVMQVDPRRNNGSKAAKTYEKTTGERKTIQMGGGAEPYDVNALLPCVSKSVASSGQCCDIVSVAFGAS